MLPDERRPVTPEEQAAPAALAATTEDVPQPRRFTSIPDGLTVQEAITWYITSLEELKRTRWGPASHPPHSRP